MKALFNCNTKQKKAIRSLASQSVGYPKQKVNNGNISCPLNLIKKIFVIKSHPSCASLWWQNRKKIFHLFKNIIRYFYLICIQSLSFLCMHTTFNALSSSWNLCFMNKLIWKQSDTWVFLPTLCKGGGNVKLWLCSSFVDFR